MDYTKEELLELYHGLSSTQWLGASTATVIAYVRSFLIVPDEFQSDAYQVRKLNPTYDDIDCTDNIRERLIQRSKNTVESVDDITISDIFGKGKQIRIALFLKKLFFDVPLKKMPLYIGKFPPVNTVVGWRLKIGK